MSDTSSRPRNLCWAISVLGLILLIIGFVIRVQGQSSAMAPALVAAINVILLGIMGVFRCIFARNQALEEAAARQYSQTHGKTELFEDADEAVRLATRANQQYMKYAVPVMTVLLGIAEIVFCLIVWFQWKRVPAFPSAENPMPLAILGVCCCIAVLIAGSYFVGASRESGCRWLRPAGAWLFFTGILYLLAGVALFFEFFGKYVEVADIYIARGALIALLILAIELVLSFIIEFYRPRMPGEEERPLPESRILALFTEPGGVARNVAASLDYQFGFQVSEAWFYRFLERTVMPLLCLMAVALWLQTCIVVVSTEEQGIMERFGRVVNREPLMPGLYFKLPAPFERLLRFPVEHIQTLTLGGHEESAEHEDHDGHKDGDHHEEAEHHDDEDERIVLWSTKHADKESNFIVAMRRQASLEAKDETEGSAPPLSIGLLAAHIPLYYKVNDIYSYLYGQGDPGKTLKSLATRELIKYLAQSDFEDILGSQRHNAGNELRALIQAAADEARLGVEIVFVSLAGLHPPVDVGPSYDLVEASAEVKSQQILLAKAYAAGSAPASDAASRTLLDQATAYKQSKMMVSKAEAERFERQLKAYDASPAIFKLNSFLEAFDTATKESRKYLITGEPFQEVFNLDLEKKVNAGLLDLDLDNIDISGQGLGNQEQQQQ